MYIFWVISNLYLELERVHIINNKSGSLFIVGLLCKYHFIMPFKYCSLYTSLEHGAPEYITIRIFFKQYSEMC